MDVKKVKRIPKHAIKSVIQDELSDEIQKIKNLIITDIRNDLHAEIVKAVALDKQEIKALVIKEIESSKDDFQKDIRLMHETLKGNIQDMQNSIRMRLKTDDSFKNNLIDDVKREIIADMQSHTESIKTSIMDSLNAEFIDFKDDFQQKILDMKAKSGIETKEHIDKTVSDMQLYMQSLIEQAKLDFKNTKTELEREMKGELMESLSSNIKNLSLDLKETIKQDVDSAIESVNFEIDSSAINKKQKAYIPKVDTLDLHKLVSALVWDDDTYNIIGEIPTTESTNIIGAIGSIIGENIVELDTTVWCLIDDANPIGKIVCQSVHFPMFVEIQKDQHVRYNNSLGKVVKTFEEEKYLDKLFNKYSLNDYKSQKSASMPTIQRRNSSIQMRGRSPNVRTMSSSERQITRRNSGIHHLSKSGTAEKKIYRLVLVKYVGY